ncbi:GGDEF domain-containing protein [Alkaliphilus peptidifermentans]|uniref:Diguanylate cyclase (GGDEF) domain-containing protein n=1 Tax=Alkaliphilus peptidifermentans DSM 18978 TaxID=1120976 RepID=A0A1G5IS98_9FIRM|nr:GGDEF domain-containing protein [Alkaliphilus peptidifermentans]SCY78620.1 diguanylate cyclase (GGDEF) domain-containing protein [Alkaliphilus peptidifermentans DSM 18978]
MITSIVVTFIAVLYYFYIDSFPTTVLTITQYAPYVIYTFGMFMAIQFNRSRIFFILLTLIISQIAVNPLWFNTYIYISICFFIPMNILFFSSLKERGYLTTWGLLRFGFIFLQACYLIWIYFGGYSKIITFMSSPIFPWEIGSPVPHYAFLLFIAALAIILVKLIAYKTFLDPFLLGVIISVFVSINFVENALLASIFFSSGGIILISAIIQLTYNMSYLDELTGLPARRALREEMMKLSGNYVIAMLDIDFFKKFNDKHGHDVGDEVLKMVAATIQQVKGKGKAYRYGGEEFTILFPSKNLKEALPYLEEVRQNIAKREFIIRDKNRPKKKPQTVVKNRNPLKKLHVTISIGASEKIKELKSPQEVLKAADKALYRAKKKGRNCVSK